VLDLTIARAGPSCVRQLADWGAEAVKVELPASPSAPGVAGEARHGSDFQNLHRNKRSLSLNLKTSEGRDVLMRLVDRADVLVENMRPSVKHRLGFGYETVHARNPRLVYGSISGFGQDGPYAERAGVDQIAQGMGGLMSVTGEPDGGPMRAGIPIADLSAGLFLAIGILAALHKRQETGEGCWVRVSLLEAMIAMMDLQAARWTVDHTVPEQEGLHHPTLVPMGCFESADGWVNIAGPSGRMLHHFCAAIGLPDLPKDPRFDDGPKRSTHRVELNAIIAERLRTRTTQEWVTILNEVGVPCGPVYHLDEVFADPQVKHLGMVEPVEHPTLGHLDLIRNPVTMTGTTRVAASAAPDPGEQSDEILADLGFSASDVAGFRERGII
jgi:formyl-CoA transferase